MPHYRMLAYGFDLIKETERNEVLKMIRVDLKYFAFLPRGTPNDIIKMVFGNIRE